MKSLVLDPNAIIDLDIGAETASCFVTIMNLYSAVELAG